jgi:uncharacterized alkaline shock family protein YloU
MLTVEGKNMTRLLNDNEYGQIMISDDVIARIAGMAAIESYGIVGMVSKNMVRDSFVELLGRDNVSKGVEIDSEDEEGLVINLYAIFAYGVRVSEVAYNIMRKVKYILESIVGVKVKSVNIHVEGVSQK